MFWPFVDLQGRLVYCPLADFGGGSVREGQDIYAQAVVAQPVTAHQTLHNARELRGKIAVVQRGGCDFVAKALRAQQAGAAAVLVANTSGNDDAGEAFVMDAGHLQQRLAASVAIPTMMIAHTHASRLFQQIREAELDRRDLFLTIRFLGAQTAARVLTQQESLDRQSRDAARSVEFKQRREQQQQEASLQLRSRLGKPASASDAAVTRSTPSASTSEFISDRSSTSSLKSDAMSSKQRSCCGESRATVEADSKRGALSASVLAMQHWCPVSTALVILDVQNYFTLRNEHLERPTAHVGETEGVCGSKEQRKTGTTSEKEADEPSLDASDADDAYYDRVENVLVPTIQDVLLASRASDGVEVIYSVVESATHDGRERSRAHKHAGIHVPKHGFGAKIPKRVAPNEDSDIVLARTGVNVFAATNLDYVLRNLGISHVVVMGISVLGSVEACVQTAMDRGYQVTVLREAVVPLAPQPRKGDTIKATLNRLARRGVQVLPAREFVSKLQSFA